jgi:uncharacterized protein (TIGR02117 family)
LPLCSISSSELSAGPKASDACIPNAAYSISTASYEANGNFNALVGCNTWTAAALRTAGLRTGWWNPLPATLNWSLDLYNRPSSSQPPGGVQP